ncbi:MAG TPA: DUF3800 domain-containing protein [Terriglobales bacterium]|jgi:hypothetical protein|nr:DUF3800 domain-containing protein [Terriglobales bacterium]
MAPSVKGRTFVFIGYIDDSADEKHVKCEALAAVFIHDKQFQTIEESLAITISNIIPPDRLVQFQEFKGWELYHGSGVFDGIDQEVRFSAIRYLLGTLKQLQIPIIYGAVDTSAIAKKSYASASPTDIAFRICMPVIPIVMTEKTEELGAEHGLEYALLILDSTDKGKRNLLKETYRQLRTKMRPPHWGTGLWYLHDEMYFGDSKDSVGLQLADLACYFIRKHLEGEDTVAETFYSIFAQQIMYGGIEPDDSPKSKHAINRLKASRS